MEEMVEVWSLEKLPTVTKPWDHVFSPLGETGEAPTLDRLELGFFMHMQVRFGICFLNRYYLKSVTSSTGHRW